jgi:hypothetical protein
MSAELKRDMGAGQWESKNHIEGKINTGQAKTVNSLSAMETKISANISAIRTSHIVFEGKIRYKLEKNGSSAL